MRRRRRDAIGTGTTGSKKQEENSDESQRRGQGGSQGRKEKRGRSGSKKHGEIEEKREGPWRAKEGINHSFSLWVVCGRKSPEQLQRPAEASRERGVRVL